LNAFLDLLQSKVYEAHYDLIASNKEVSAELKSLEEKVFSIERLAQVKDLILFSCYTVLAYADTTKLTPANIEIGNDGDRPVTKPSPIPRKSTGIDRRYFLYWKATFPR
jgi:hypothetical protein